MTTRGNELAAMTAERNKVIQELAELKLSINALDLMDIPRMRCMRNHLIDQAKTNQDRADKAVEMLVQTVKERDAWRKVAECYIGEKAALITFEVLKGQTK